MLDDGLHATLGAKDVNATYVSRILRQLTLLAPEIYGVLVKF